MPSLDDLYKIIGVKSTAKKEQIKKAYRKKAKKLHPDKGGNPDEFTKLDKAYEILMDDFKKSKYENGFNPDGNVEKEARVYLFEVFSECLPEKILGRDRSKILKYIDMKIGGTLSNCSNSIERDNQKIKELNYILPAVEVKIDDENIYREVINKQIETLNSNINFSKTKIEILEKAKEILKNYTEKDLGPILENTLLARSISKYNCSTYIEK